MTKFQAGIAAVLALIIGILAALFVAPDKGDQASYLSLYPQPRALPPFELTDNHGAAFSNTQLQGHWNLLFVGYTFCPDVCPTTLAELTKIYPQLKNLPSEFPIQVVFLSVDPQRDTTERLDEYINFFEPDFVAVSGEHKQLFPLVRALGMMYSMVESTDNPNYLVDHSASVVLINPQVEVLGRFKPEHNLGKVSLSNSEKILADLAIITAP